MPRVRQPLVLSLALTGLVACVFWPVLKHQFIIYDDADYVTANRFVQSGLNLAAVRWAFMSTHAANWHPLTWLSHMLDCQLYGLQPWGHHLTSLLLHAFNTALVFLVFRSMTGATGRSFVVAALFGLHPLRVESVAWVAERKDVLSTFFCLLTLWAYSAYSQARAKIKTPAPGETHPARDSWRAVAAYVLSLLFFALGLMSKPMLVTLPFLLLLLDYWPLRRNAEPAGRSASSGQAREFVASWAKLTVEKIPFFLLAAGTCAITFLVQKQAGAVMQRASLDLKLENALIGYCRYLGKLFWPANLSVFYPFPATGWPMADAVLASLLVGSVSLLTLALARRRPYFPVGWFWFVGTLVPVIGMIQVGAQSIADRYAYIPSIGICVLLVWAADDLMQRWSFRVPIAVTLSAGAILVCLAATRQELPYWQDGETLFRRALAVTRPDAITLEMLGEELASRQKLAAAVPLYQEAIRLSPDYANAWQNLGVDLLQQGKLEETIDLFRRDIHANPDDAQAHRNLGAALAKAARWPEAAAEFGEAIRLRPAYAAAHRGLGSALVHQLRLDEAMNEYLAAIRLDPETHDYGAVAEILATDGRLDEAVNQLRQAIQFDPANANPHLLLGRLLVQKNSMNEAAREFAAASHLDPKLAQAHYLLGGALAELGRSDEAIAQFQAALQIQPEYADAQNDLGMALDAKGLFAEAIVHSQEAVQLSPGNPETHNNLGASLANLGRLDDAVAQFREALRLDPANPGAQKNLEAVLAAKTSPPKN